MKNIILSLGLIFFVTIVFLFADILIAAGAFKKIKPHGAIKSQKLQLPVAGPEDLTLDSISGNLYISADDRRSNQQQTDKIKGAILLINLNDTLQKLKNITPAAPSDFHPHGIALWKADSGRTILLAVNHRSKEKLHTIERFEVINDSLIHLESISDMTLMSSPNDLVATGPRTFYVTNDHYYADEGINRTLEDYLQRAISYVNYYDGKTFRKVATNIAYANGIQGNADRSEIYVASTTGRKILVFKSDKQTGLLELQNEIFTATGVDNIETDGDGNLWIGCHPQLLKFVAHATSAKNYSPSQVIRIKLKPDGSYQQEEIFLNDGQEYSGSTTGIIFKGNLYIGSVFESTLLRVVIDDKSSSQHPY